MMRQVLGKTCAAAAATLLLLPCAAHAAVVAHHARRVRTTSHTTRPHAATAPAAAIASAPAAAPGSDEATATAAAGTDSGQVSMLHLRALHTGESLDVVYKIGDNYVPDAIEKLNYFLRDSHTNDVSSYDPREFDVLHSLMAKLHKPDGVIDVVCGYRTALTNEMLRTRAKVTGVAKNSQHILAKAIDIRVPGVSTQKLRDVALSLHEGGVGYYPVSKFVHVDVGPVRKWTYRGASD